MMLGVTDLILITYIFFINSLIMFMGYLQEVKFNIKDSKLR